MALAPQIAPFEILDLRLVRARALAALFAEQQRQWRDDLHWDYQPSVEMIRKHIDAQNLPGYVALQQGRVAGYSFYVYEEEKGLIGDLYVLAEHRQERPRGNGGGIATLLLEHTLETLEHSPIVRRIEAQLIPFGLEPLAPVFQAHDFRAFPRLFLYRRLEPADAAALSPAGKNDEPLAVELRGWDDGYFEPMADLIVAAYANHVDSQINDHYSARAGALRFLKNIVVFPGCGVFQPECSFVAAETVGARNERLLGAVLVSQVAPRVGHVTQICVRPGAQGRGFGRRLMNAALARLAQRAFTGVSLTVTAENQPAVELYRRLGFTIIKEFAAVARALR